jgi:hypothetical protein
LQQHQHQQHQHQQHQHQSHSHSQQQPQSQLAYSKPWVAQLPWPHAQPLGKPLQRSHSVDGYYTELDMMGAANRASPRTADPTPLSEYRTSYRHEPPARSSFEQLRAASGSGSASERGRCGSVYEEHMPGVAGRIFRAKINMMVAAGGGGTSGAANAAGAVRV